MYVQMHYIKAAPYNDVIILYRWRTADTRQNILIYTNLLHYIHNTCIYNNYIIYILKCAMSSTSYYTNLIF